MIEEMQKIEVSKNTDANNGSDFQYWVYCHITPDGMYYIGSSKQKTSKRWQPSHYKETALWPYIEQYGWNNIQHKVLLKTENKEMARMIEDELRDEATEMGVCINKRRAYMSEEEKKEEKAAWYAEHKEEHAASMAAWRAEHKEEQKEYQASWYAEHKEEIKASNAAWYQEHKEERAAYDKKRLSTPEGKIYNRVHNFNYTHPDRQVETALEAKQKYLDYGYIPDYIKNDDLL